MAGSKRRLLWRQVPDAIRGEVERMAGAAVVGAENCVGGFSPGLASRLTLADGGRMFVKAINGQDWPSEVTAYRTEAYTMAALPAEVPAPRLRGSYDDGEWVVLGFDDVDGHEPAQPWRVADFDRVLAAIGELSTAAASSSLGLPSDHPRLGGWSELADDDVRVSRLPAVSRWAADQLGCLVALETDGLAAAQGASLVHFDLYPHNILLGGDRVFFVDWPHARLGAAFLDVITVLSTALSSGIDPESRVAQHPLTASVDPHTITAVIAALAGFHLATGLNPAPPELRPILDAKIQLGRTTLQWLARRTTVDRKHRR